jgi:protein gp37
MSQHSNIEWTDSTWNPVTGCSVVSPGCTNCYAMKLAGTRLRSHISRSGLTHETKAGPVWTGEVRFNEQWLTQPLRWKKPQKIFVCAHGDLFHEAVPDEWIDRVFAVMALAPRHTFQVLTKRAQRMRAYCSAMAGFRWMEHMRKISPPPTGHGVLLNTKNNALPNVWLGVSVEDQKRAEERIPLLLKTPAAVRFISAEPLLGPVDLARAGLEIDMGADLEVPAKTNLHWVIVGGESGSGARPMHPDWVHSLRDQCTAANVPFFFKQWGEWRGMHIGQRNPYPNFVKRDPADTRNANSGCFHLQHVIDACVTDPTYGWRFPVLKVGKKSAGRLLDGREWNEFPEAA